MEERLVPEFFLFGAVRGFGMLTPAGISHSL